MLDTNKLCVMEGSLIQKECRNHEVICTDNWEWKPFEGDDKFWVGKDENEKKWLFKNRGSFRALREMVFSLIGEYLGLNVQLSRYAIFPGDFKGLGLGDKYQLVIEYIEPCKNDYQAKFDSYERAYENNVNSLNLLIECGHIDAIDHVKAEMLAFIFGANDESDILLAENGRVYTIDNEQFFSTGPIDLMTCNWLRGNESVAMNIATGLCEKLALLNRSDIEFFTSVPNGYKVEEIWPIKPLIIEGCDYARKFTEKYA